MFLPRKYIKSAFNQGITITILLGVLPFSFALGQDIWAAITNNSHELSNFNNMIASLLPSNHTYINLLMWLSGVYLFPLFVLVVAERNFKRKIPIPKWIKSFILNFEYALSTIFSIMFIASSTFFTLGLFLSFSSLGLSYGIGFIILGLILFFIPTYALAGMLELKDSFLNS